MKSKTFSIKDTFRDPPLIYLEEYVVVSMMRAPVHGNSKTMYVKRELIMVVDLRLKVYT